LKYISQIVDVLLTLIDAAAGYSSYTTGTIHELHFSTFACLSVKVQLPASSCKEVPETTVSHEGRRATSQDLDTPQPVQNKPYPLGSSCLSVFSRSMAPNISCLYHEKCIDTLL